MLAGLAAAAAAGLDPVKVNSVLVRDCNLDEAPELLAWALRNGYRLRFIEHMPLDADHLWSREQMVTAEEILELLGRRYALRPREHRAHAPAEEFDVLDGPDRGAVGRTGRPARHHRLGHPAVLPRLRPAAADRRRPAAYLPVRARGDRPARPDARRRADAELAEIIRAAVADKQAGHGIGNADFVQPDAHDVRDRRLTLAPPPAVRRARPGVAR